jgi:competence protein ComGC
MNRHSQLRGCQAFSLLELLVIVVVITLVVLVLVPSLREAKQKSQQIDCLNNLKQVGLAFRLWAGDSMDRMPMNATASRGGTKEVANEAWRTFQVLSNELSTPKLLICPSDNRPAAASWLSLQNSNLSYFVGLDAEEWTPSVLLSGDHNLTNGRAPASHVLPVDTNETVGWTSALHKRRGNIGLSDGSVHLMERESLNRQIAIGLTELAAGYRSPINPPPSTLRLALPE